jgi:hypothetical protein
MGQTSREAVAAINTCGKYLRSSTAIQNQSAIKWPMPVVCMPFVCVGFAERVCATSVHGGLSSLGGSESNWVKGAVWASPARFPDSIF